MTPTISFIGNDSPKNDDEVVDVTPILNNKENNVIKNNDNEVVVVMVSGG